MFSRGSVTPRNTSKPKAVNVFHHVAVDHEFKSKRDAWITGRLVLKKFVIAVVLLYIIYTFLRSSQYVLHNARNHSHSFSFSPLDKTASLQQHKAPERFSKTASLQSLNLSPTSFQTQPYTTNQPLEFEISRKQMKRILLHDTYHLEGATRAKQCHVAATCPQFEPCGDPSPSSSSSPSSFFISAKCLNPDMVDDWIHGKPPKNWNQSMSSLRTTVAPYEVRRPSNHSRAVAPFRLATVQKRKKKHFSF